MAANNLRYNPHLRLTWGGDIGDPAMEQWTNGLHLVDFTDGDLPSDEELQDGLNYIAPFISAWFIKPQMQISPAVRLGWAKLNRLDEYGHQPGNTIRHDFPAAIYGGGNGTTDWNQTFACTLRTAKQRGRAHAGRIFPPVVCYNPTGKTPYIAAAEAASLAEQVGLLLNTITVGLRFHWNDAVQVPHADYDFVPAVVSPGLRDKGTQEVRERITSVVVDRVPDVQHRRTAQVPRNEGAPYVIPFA